MLKLLLVQTSCVSLFVHERSQSFIHPLRFCLFHAHFTPTIYIFHYRSVYVESDAVHATFEKQTCCLFMSFSRFSMCIVLMFLVIDTLFIIDCDRRFQSKNGCTFNARHSTKYTVALFVRSFVHLLVRLFHQNNSTAHIANNYYDLKRVFEMQAELSLAYSRSEPSSLCIDNVSFQS